MKAIIILLLFFNICYSQIDSISLSFYPLNTGDYWEYEQIVYSWDMFYPPTYDTSYYSIEIVSDTIMPNLIAYKILKRTNLDSSRSRGNLLYFERVDSTSCNVYQFYKYAPNNEYLRDSLKSMKNDTSRSSHDLMFGYRDFVKTVCTDISINTYFIIQKYAKHFEADVLDPFQYILLEDIGLFYFRNSFDFGWMKIELKFALINGTIYGDKINSLKDSNTRTNFPKFKLQQNYPNPFNNSTIIKYYLDRASNVELNLYSITGEKLFEIYNGNKPIGYHSAELKADALSSGIYIYTIKSGDFIDSKKCILIK